MKDNFCSETNITKWGTEILCKAGLSYGDALLITEALVNTSLWGIDSHGIARIPHYLARFEAGSIKTNPDIKFKQTAAATGELDGDDGHGILILRQATESAIKLASEAGVGTVGVKNSSHCGAIGLYTRQIAKAGMVGIAFTHSDSFVVPQGGTKPFFGTNPISIAFPTENIDEPICLDMATSIIPWNFIMNAKREGTEVPVGYGVDTNGDDTQIASDIVAVKPMAAHKGYAMAFMIDMLCGPLNGMEFGSNITPMYQELDKKRGLGSLVIAIDPERFGGRNTVRLIGGAMINQLRLQDSKILFPGQPEYIRKKERLQNGIPVSTALESEFKYWSDKLDVKMPVWLIK